MRLLNFIPARKLILESPLQKKSLLDILRDKMQFSSAIINFLIVIGGAALFFPLLGGAHLFDWDEANFAESAREMIVTGDYFHVQIAYDIFWEKPPLFIWLQAISMHLFGINEFAARFPNAVAGIVTLLVLFNIGNREFDKRFGLLWVMAYACSILPHFYFKSGIIDPWFNLFIFLGLYQIAKLSQLDLRNNSRTRRILLAAVFIGLAILTKGPVAFLIIWICVAMYFLVKKSIRVFSFKELLVFIGMVALISFAWFGIGIIKDGPFFITEFIAYQVRLFSTEGAGHGGPVYYHFLVLLLGCFPASIYIFKSFIRQYSDTPSQRNLKMWMIISLFVVLILFSIVQTKIVHYSSFCYFPITFLAAYALHKVYRHRTYFSKAFHIWFVVLGGIISLVLILVPLFMKYRELLLAKGGKYIGDEFVLENLKSPVEWTGSEISIGCFYLAAIVLATIYHYRQPIIGAAILFVSTLITVQFTMYMIVPKVEAHIQGSVINFYKAQKGKDVYLESVGFKSYADLFYAERVPGLKSASKHSDWLMNGPIDKDAYLVRKINHYKEMDQKSDLEKLGSENGYVFYKRKKVNTDINQSHIIP
ncbi:MAG: glycosyltransferase family 39 protein [Cytophagaceae bacterium]|nr:glycosyltransferase family 39 protein [Cytophagaceae bacterium]